MYGIPVRVISDRGTAFTADEVENFHSERGIEQVKVAVAAPWANGIVEKVNRFLRSTLAKTAEAPNAWYQALERTQYVLNNTFHNSINSTPSELLLGYKQRGAADTALDNYFKALAEVDKDIHSDREEARQLAIETDEKTRAYNKTQYDSRQKVPTKYNKDDLVMMKSHGNAPGENQKLLPEFKGPYIVKDVLGLNCYVITDVPGYQLTQKVYEAILSPDRLKPWIRVGNPEEVMLSDTFITDL
ncbi:uncharacterized protein LOC143373320 [Andrena cerasifolii]|uniref:uncharacterized protein LOC143373320 n=1 Tax=Andrena cerasifolii TaxID=2819439 RepID=UPI00403764AA